MIFGFKTLIYALVGVVGAMVLTQTVFRGALGLPKDLRNSLFSAALIVNAFFFLSPSPLIFLVGSAIALFFIGKGTNRAMLGVFLLPLLPNTQMQFLSLPGINYLLPLSFQMILAVTVFLPALRGEGAVRLGGYKFFERAFLFLAFASILLAFRTDAITHNLRGALVTLLTFVVPFLAVVRSIDTREKFILLFKVLIIALVIMACVAFVAQQFWWDFYSGQNQRLFGVSSLTKARGSLLRITSTFGYAYINVGILLVMGALFSTAFAPKAKGLLSRYGLPALLLFGALMTASRSPYIAGILALPVLLTAFPNVLGKVMRFALIGVVSIGLVSISPLGSGVADFMPSFDSDEEQSYRSQLMEVGIQEIRKKPLLGDEAYYENPNFEVLRQGEGIIDFVNSYLEKALHYGVPLAALYLFLAVAPAFFIWRAARKTAAEDTEWRFLGAALSAGLICFAAGLFGTATNGQTEDVQYVVLAISICFLRINLATAPAKASNRRAYPGSAATLAPGAA